MAWHLPVVACAPGRWQIAGGLHRSWREPWFLMLRDVYLHMI